MPKMNDHSTETRKLTPEDIEALEKQNSRLVTDFKAKKFEREAQKHWDIFYKRNTTNFFKDRHWTTREFQDLAKIGSHDSRVLLEVGCGVGNFLFPLLEDNPKLFIYACDFSPRAVEFVKRNEAYSSDRVNAFQHDITLPFPDHVKDKVDIVSMIFVLSAIAPSKFVSVFKNLKEVLRSGGRILFRDYAVNDHAMLRFKSGTKIADQLYLRQDGTTSYFFELEGFRAMVETEGFTVKSVEYVHRKTVNVKESVDVQRVFLQAVLEIN